jgi:hypothetical protein
VARVRTFVEHLDAALEIDAPSAPGMPPPPDPVWFIHLHESPPRQRSLNATREHLSHRVAFDPPQPRPRVRPARHLSAAQRDALAALVALGARLGADFTARELRSEFRALARRYHPDSHPHAGDAERTQWGRQFALVRECYERLRSEK